MFKDIVHAIRGLTEAVRALVKIIETGPPPSMAERSAPPVFKTTVEEE